MTAESQESTIKENQQKEENPIRGVNNPFQRAAIWQHAFSVSIKGSTSGRAKGTRGEWRHTIYDVNMGYYSQ
jgi:hypothetical protein